MIGKIVTLIYRVAAISFFVGVLLVVLSTNIPDDYWQILVPGDSCITEQIMNEFFLLTGMPTMFLGLTMTSDGY